MSIIITDHFSADILPPIDYYTKSVIVEFHLISAEQVHSWCTLKDAYVVSAIKSPEVNKILNLLVGYNIPTTAVPVKITTYNHIVIMDIRGKIHKGARGIPEGVEISFWQLILPPC